ncbi:lysophospholipid acyltransferase 5-like [Ptychodera flava]|uniref:lysophospholipid acyltransferase 5-like n=1 Tax=Ptychodera flava TaxID=63121 RepID=UPI003969ED53
MAVFAVDEGPIAKLSDLTGVPEAGLRFLLSVLFGYPLALIQRNFIHGRSMTLHHVFFITCGLCLSYFNYGVELYHFLISILVNYSIITIVGGTSVSVFLAFLFNMGYLITAYIFTATDTYDITWTTPQCVLTLRMIGLVFDVYDGSKPAEKLSADQKTTALNQKPTILEISAYAFFYGGFFAGPQFPLRRYLDMCSGVLTDGEKGETPNSIRPAVNRFILGVIYCGVTVVLVPMIPNSYLYSDEFGQIPYLKRMLVIAIWGHLACSKYMPVWLFAEGSCILAGLAYNGKDKDNKAKWDACRNVDLYVYETTPTFKGAIQSFNVNTNQWVLRYVYKRLRFLGNKLISQAAVLVFLAMWHGLYIGYYICFMLEAFITNVEVQMIDTANMTGLSKLYENPILKVPIYIVCKLWQLTFMGYPLMGFMVLTWERTYKAYSAIYWSGHIFYCFAFPALYTFVLKPVFGKRKKTDKEGTPETKGKTD